MGVDALRIDTVKHVPRDNLLEYVNAWKEHKPGLFVFGENLVKGYGWGDLGGGDNGPSFIRPWWYTRQPDPVIPIPAAIPVSATRFWAVSPLSAITSAGVVMTGLGVCWKWTGFTAMLLS